ncbi:unnamed protein product [Closterium sp. Naga37s-1]|nr:unnamed protein product [Closterium sp. Naga37s-1]
MSRPRPRIISGGQTGADRGALMAARALGVPFGGSCPKGRRAEDGEIPRELAERMAELPQAEYYGGRADAAELCDEQQQQQEHSESSKVCCRRWQGRMGACEERVSGVAERVCVWLEQQQARVVNVAGPRESEQPGLTRAAVCFTTALLLRWKETLP